ncbi:hypothetical protein [Vibrio sp. 16]|uniref:hypothetical protein n=1 Tax=Vibrio sp. 16 TaxID=391586 RepID=UPI00018F2299|nr:hypothetical protein VPMS16_305 [Vibrio sp. 16]
MSPVGIHDHHQQKENHRARSPVVFDYQLLAQQASCFLPDLFLAAYAAGHQRIAHIRLLRAFLAAYAAGHAKANPVDCEEIFLAAYAAGHCKL